MRNNYKEVKLMGYTLQMDVRETEKSSKYYLAHINSVEAKEKNRFSPDMSVVSPNLLADEDNNEYRIATHITGLGNVTLEEYPKYLEAMQKAYHVAQELQEILNQYMENN